MKQLLQQHPHPILLGNKLSAETWQQFLDTPAAQQVSVVMDENTAEHCWPIVSNWLPPSISPIIITIPAGEAHKSIEMVQLCWQQWLQAKAGRDLLVLALGGGVLTDLVQFAANTFKRGTDCILIPTSLLGMVDAAAGGKNGINLAGYKNVIGTFSPPKAVCIDLQFLQTLPRPEWHNGLAETLKHAIIEGKALWQFLRLQPALEDINWEKLVADSLRVKLRLVQKDYRDKGIRQLLNLGHTFGHALEAWSMQTAQPLKHGEAVAIGIVYETWLSYLSGYMSKRSANSITRTIRHFFPHLSLTAYSLPDIAPLMQQDKKKQGHTIFFALPVKPGLVKHGLAIEDPKVMEQAFLATQSIFN